MLDELRSILLNQGLLFALSGCKKGAGKVGENRLFCHDFNDDLNQLSLLDFLAEITLNFAPFEPVPMCSQSDRELAP